MANGDIAREAGLPVSDPEDDIRMGYDAINALADALARVITSAWKESVNTTKGIATTGNINANGKVTANEGQFNVNLLVGGQLSVTGNINTNGEVRSNVLIVGGRDVLAVLTDHGLRINALEGK